MKYTDCIGFDGSNYYCKICGKKLGKTWEKAAEVFKLHGMQHVLEETVMHHRLF
ncbi:MAG: hypothetical protein J7K36_01270 [Archaeoglobaceae archaeon]|nr:hypothetical protein [Archaeoglobaceae archaeon]